MTDDKQMCLGCGQSPATRFNGTLPLCSKCAAEAEKKKRGVQYKSKNEVKASNTLRS